MKTTDRRLVLKALVLCALGGTLLIGCSESPQSPTSVISSEAGWHTLRSTLERELLPGADADDLAELVDGNHQFALDIYHALEEEEGNLLLSSFSIRTAFAMAYAGARGETEAEIAEVLHFTLGQAGQHDAFNAQDLELRKRNHPGTSSEDPVELYVANAFWGRTGTPFLEDYLDILALNYGSGIESLDFGRDPEGCRQIINTWVEERTRERIKDLLPPYSIDPLVIAVLTNALYFKAPWAQPFEHTTRDSPFQLLDGSVVRAPTMDQVNIFGYAEGPGYQALEMTYRMDELSMVFLLPPEGEFELFEEEMDMACLHEILDGLEPAPVEVYIPKFRVESASLELRDVLVEMGMVAPFSGHADFTGMLEYGGIFIDEVYHKTFINVDEKGTEAAAATAIVMRFESGPPPPEHEFKADRPFMYLIRDRVTGTILFMGRVLDPTG